MGKHKVPNYHDYRCGECGQFMIEYGGYMKEIGFRLYPVEVCIQCNRKPNPED